MSSAEIWLYGSAARGDQDEASDVDVLVASDRPLTADELRLPVEGPISLSRYGWRELEHMAGYGSLFLHHLKLEGRPLREQPERRLRVILSELGEYQRADLELSSFRQVLDDVEHSLEGDFSAAYELSVIATAARHAAILGCYLLGEPDFGRSSAFRALLPRLGYSTPETESFVQLYCFRRAEDWGEPVDQPDFTADVSSWVTRVRSLIDEVGDLSA
ncbi:MAG TPA: nucleotidyltransferase domain-containing protein [Solirubrobacterales bacterium]